MKIFNRHVEVDKREVYLHIIHMTKEDGLYLQYHLLYKKFVSWFAFKKTTNLDAILDYLIVKGLVVTERIENEICYKATINLDECEIANIEF